MDFDSPEEIQEFPGLYASDAADARSKKSKEESDLEDHDHSKKDLLIGRRKDKKEKGKDRGYAALEGESSPEEELDTKSPSKSKKSKTFKFTSSKSKEKREKSRDKEKSERETKHVEEEPLGKEHKAKEKDRDKEKEKEKEREREEQKKKEKKDKGDKKDKAEKKDKKDKKSKQLSQQQDEAEAEEVLALGYPVFGVSVSLATERSRCHDGVDLPLVVRDCIDYLQDHLKCEQIYKIEPIKTRLMHFKRLYNNREHDAAVDELNLPTACSLLKLFLRELPEPVLTTDLVARFEEVASHPKVTEQQAELQQLLEQLPKCNRTLLAWVLLHFDAVIQQERYNKLNAQSLAMLLSPTLQMSHRLMVALLCHCNSLFADVKLIKYVPPLTSASPKLPDRPEEIQTELRKQDSLLAQIHSEMNAGFITKKREEQLWEVQRIITQLKRKLRTFEKKHGKSAEDLENSSMPRPEPDGEDRTDSKPPPAAPTAVAPATNSIPSEEPSNPSPDFTIDPSTGFIVLPRSNPHRETLLRLQIEYDELMDWENELKARILAERNECYRLKQLCDQQQALSSQASATAADPVPPAEGDYERIIEHYTRENALLEHKKQMLGMELKEERRACIALQVELRLKQF
ncbi:hypothetical protein KR032_012011 [Drosophila birchii]|nr:hypothetical protein KR032_012011 [Drosophila birchii]